MLLCFCVFFNFYFRYLNEHVMRFHGGFIASFILCARFETHMSSFRYFSIPFLKFRVFLFICLFFRFFSVLTFLFFCLVFFDVLWLSLPFLKHNYFYLLNMSRGFMAVSWRSHGPFHTLGSICETQEYLCFFVPLRFSNYCSVFFNCRYVYCVFYIDFYLCFMYIYI